MLFDIDDFKRYNDEHGHDIGDEVLKEIVLLLHSCIRRGDRCFRIGGDEFAVLFSDPEGPRRGGVLDRETATMIARRFQRAVSDLNLSHIGLEGPGTISVSTGFAAFPWHGLEPITLYRAADGFCLESKRAGKNRITFGPGMPEPDQPKA
jgi:diguanylate cyclase (GGDEF)-like protein